MAARKNPFPGMNPYLEDSWSDVHASLIAYFAKALQYHLPAGLFARIRVSSTFEYGHGVLVRSTCESEQMAEAWALASKPGMSTEAPPETEYDSLGSQYARYRWIEVVDAKADNVVITNVDVLTPSNKGSNYEAYMLKRQRALSAGVNYVEVDLLRQPVGEYYCSSAARADDSPYTISITQAGSPLSTQVYHVGLLQPLPAVRIPLRTREEAVTVELQPLLNAAYEDGAYGQTINYQQPLEPPLTPEALAYIASGHHSA